MKYSFKKINIEAPFKTTQCGHVCQTFLLDEYKDHLYARVIALQDDNDFIIHISLDLLSFNLEYRNLLQDKLRHYYKNDNLHLITSATHTHYANSVSNNAYMQYLIDLLYAQIIKMEYVDKGDIFVTYNKMHSTSCGKSRISGYETNLEYLCLVRLYDQENTNFFSMLINNCHPTTLHESTRFFSSEYPGYVLKLLEEKYPNTDFSFIQGACGDISSRFVRTGQEYKDMQIIANNLFNDVNTLINEKTEPCLLRLNYNEKLITYEYDFSPLTIDNIRTDLSARELETIKEGQMLRASLSKDKPNEIFGMLLDEIVLASLNLGAVKIIFYPNEIFSSYMDELDLNSEILVSYSNGYGPYILPIDFPYLTYEMFLDTLTRDCKIKIKKEINNI